MVFAATVVGNALFETGRERMWNFAASVVIPDRSVAWSRK